jgi:hypothetical protein
MPGAWAVVRICKIWPLHNRGLALWRLPYRQTDQLVEFPPVKPHPTALGAIVNLNALAVHHYQSCIRANGALHAFLQKVLKKLQKLIRAAEAKQAQQA